MKYNVVYFILYYILYIIKIMAQFPKGQKYGYSSEYNPLLIEFTKVINELKELNKKADELENEIEIAEEESVTLPRTEKDREAYKTYINELRKKRNEIVSRINSLMDKRDFLRLRMAQIVSIYKLKNLDLSEQVKELEKINLETLKQLENELIKKIGIPDLPKVQPWISAKPKKPPVPPANTNVGYIPEPEPSNTNLPPGQPKEPPPPPPPIGMGIRGGLFTTASEFREKLDTLIKLFDYYLEIVTKLYLLFQRIKHDEITATPEMLKNMKEDLASAKNLYIRIKPSFKAFRNSKYLNSLATQNQKDRLSDMKDILPGSKKWITFIEQHL